MAVTPSRRGPGRGARRPAADDVEAAAREATRRAERQRFGASCPPVPGARRKPTFF